MIRKDRPDQIHSSAEMLEDRIAPATLPLLDLSGGTVIGTFTDADGDRVTVRIEGVAGKAEFQDAGGNSVDDGENIASVIITGPSADFALTYSFEASGGTTNTVTMGNITSNKVLRGIFSVPLDGTTGAFTLGSFVGPGFSAGGGLSADEVADGIGIQLNGLEAGRSINIRDSFLGDLAIQGSLAGSILVGGDVGEASAWQIHKAVAATAQIVVSGRFDGGFEAHGSFAGDVMIGSSASGLWKFDKNVLKSAQLTAERWDNVEASKNWGGQLFAVFSDTTIVVHGQILRTSVFSGEGRLELTVDGSVQAGAAFGFTSDITVTVGGNVAGTWVSSQDVVMTVGGNVSGAVIDSGSDLALTVSKGILKSQIHSDGDLTLSISGGVTSANLTAASGIVAEVSGSVTKSNLEGSSADTTLTIGGNLTGSRVTSGLEDLVLNITGIVARSTLAALESNVMLTIEGSITDTRVTAAKDLIGTIGHNVVRSSFDSNDANVNDTAVDLNLTVAGEFIGSHATADGDLALAVTKDVKTSSITSTNGAVSTTVAGDMAGSQIEAALAVELGVSGRLVGSKIAGDEGTIVGVVVGLDVIGSSVDGLDQPATLTVGRNLISSTVVSAGIAQITVAGSLLDSQLSSGNDISVSVTKDVIRSTIISSQSNATVDVSGNFLASSVTCDEDMEVSIGGNMSGLVNSFDSSITLTVGGTMSGKAISGGDLLADIGQLTGSLSADQLDLVVQGSVASSARIEADNVDDTNGDTFGFHVDGDFGGLLNVVDFDSDVTGGSMLVGGDVLKSARFNIARNLGSTADESFSFGGDFLGVLNVGGDIDVNLSFNGDVNQVIIGGLVGTTGVVNTITVLGKLKFLSTGSLFEETTPGKAGSFKNGAGAETATLSAEGGFVTVIPTA